MTWWTWWLSRDGGLPLLIGLIASFTSLVIAIGTAIVNARTTREALDSQIQAQTASIERQITGQREAQHEQANQDLSRAAVNHQQRACVAFLSQLQRIIVAQRGPSPPSAEDEQDAFALLMEQLTEIEVFVPDLWQQAVLLWDAAGQLGQMQFAQEFVDNAEIERATADYATLRKSFIALIPTHSPGAVSGTDAVSTS